MDLSHRIDKAMSAAISRAQGASVPARAVPGRLAAALHYAVTPGGARIRPTICLSVAKACGDDRPALADSAAIALELIHCASLVHDDLPAFDNADFGAASRRCIWPFQRTLGGADRRQPDYRGL